MYYYIRLLKNTPVEAVIQEPFKIVFTITTDLTEKFYDKPCKLKCQAVIRAAITHQDSVSDAENLTTIIPQGLSQGSSLDYDPNIGYCSVDLRIAPCLTAYDECQLVLSLDPTAFNTRQLGAKCLVEPPEYEIIPAWSLPIRLRPAALDFSRKTKHRQGNKKNLTDTRQDLVERHFRLPPHFASKHGSGRSLLVREDATEGIMARHIWDSGVFMAKYLMQEGSWLSQYMSETREHRKKEEAPIETSLSNLSVTDMTNTSSDSTAVSMPVDIPSTISADVTAASPSSIPNYSKNETEGETKSEAKTKNRERVCLELGAGTGLVGIAVAIAFPELNVLSTDLDEALTLMQQNVDANAALLPDMNIKVGFLDWTEKDRVVNPVEILLLADVVYNDLSHDWLLQTILDYSDEETKVLLGYKFRHEAEQKFFDRAKAYFDIVNVHQQDTMQLFVLTRKVNI
ncbi:hypothetical protein BX616_007065 [Lobosporangium transversale]|uniref:Putative methyltransferase-domain-containing protein n=1 Tax=Lobosporangium transversale TaxID=64571 RepID=A0A1Y2GAZ0_9FUNG|nr:putative methyltransferase-domain-containing protein [Lobosporangium transversale]KAF9919341.1 hypothetical protein BX616_007065 [Lobosporangium transversale]ORZ05917.1 putative methyltransferase-domain-containing protein [Lobosporangium transversale]|eukprot:XP_021877298.1 putative methyltransferase-domain-containing protein [Lobosporangium transversale]